MIFILFIHFISKERKQPVDLLRIGGGLNNKRKMKTEIIYFANLIICYLEHFACLYLIIWMLNKRTRFSGLLDNLLNHVYC